MTTKLQLLTAENSAPGTVYADAQVLCQLCSVVCFDFILYLALTMKQPTNEE